MAASRMRTIQDGEDTALADSFSRAFFDDPLTTFVMPDVEKRTKQSNWMFQKLIGYCRRYGHVYTDDNQTAGSVWLPPGNTTMTPIRTALTGLWQMPFRIGWGGFSRFGKLDGVASKAHKRAVQGDHWYLLGLGVDPNTQKTGLGTEAIDIGAARAKADGLPVYLETMTQTNVDFYTKRGFDVVEELTVEDDLKIWTMLKPAS